MKSRYILFLFILILASSLSIGAEDEFNDEIYDKGVISFQSKLFKFYISEDIMKVDSDGVIMMIAPGDCVISDNVNVCLENVTFDLEKEDYKASINLTKKYADIEVIRTLSSSTLIIGKEYHVDVTLKNKGNNIAKDIEYTELIPLSVAELTDCEDCDIEDERVYFNDVLGVGDEVTFTYYFVPLSDEEYTYNGNMEYYSKGEFEQMYTKSLTIRPKHPLSVKFSYNKFEYIGDEVELEVEIKNDEQGDIDISDVQVYVPTNLILEINKRTYDSGKAYSLGPAYLDDKTTSYDEIVTRTEIVNGTPVQINETVTRKNETQYKYYNIDLVPKVAGTYEFIFDIYYEYEERYFKYQGIKSRFEIDELKPEVEASIEDNDDFDETSEQHFYLQLINPYEDISVNDAVLKLESPMLFAPRTFRIENIEKGISKRIFYERITLPKVNDTIVNTYFLYNLSFYDDYGNFYRIDDNISFNIVPLKDVILESSGCTMIKFDEKCTMTVTITNNLKGEIKNVFIRDIFDKRINTEGPLYGKVDVDGETKLTAYTYDIIYPEKINDLVENVSITTLASFEYLDREYLVNSTTSVIFEGFKEKKDFEVGLSTVFDSSKFTQGSVYPVSLTVENKDDELMQNLVLSLKESAAFDFVDVRDKQFESLNPGEKKYFKFYIKIKGNESIDISGKLSFEDEKGYDYENIFTEKRINSESANPVGPFITITMESTTNSSDIGDLVPIKIMIENKGTEEAYLNFTFSEGQKEQLMYLKAGSSRILREMVLINSNENITVPMKSATYEYAKRKYYVFSDELTIDPTAGKVNSSEGAEMQPESDSSSENQTINSTQDTNSTQDGTEEENESSWFSRLFSKVKSLFGL